MGQSRLLDLVNFMAILIVSTACHEAAHARLADHFGDGTPREHGRISWNPLVHIHPIYTVLLPGVLYWVSGNYFAAAWTPVNPSRMRNPRLHGLLVSLGGPATNLLLAILFFGILAGYVISLGGLPRESADREWNLFEVLLMAGRMNLFLAMFNFLPIPPLDGSNLVSFALPPRLRVRWIEFRQHAWILFLVLMVTDVLGMIFRPVMHFLDAGIGSGLTMVHEFARRG